MSARLQVLVLWADHESENLGVRVLAQGAAEIARKAWPECEVHFLSFGDRPGAPRVSWRALVPSIAGQGKLREWLAGFDVVLDTRAGDSFTDIYGASRFAQMTILGNVASRVAQAVLMPQTIGPFTTGWSRAAASLLTGNYQAVLARDSTSFEIAEQILKPIAISSSDLVFALPVEQPQETFDTLLNVSGLLWDSNPHADVEQYRRIVRTIIGSELDRGHSVTLLPHVLANRTRDDDVKVLEQLTYEFPDLAVRVPADLKAARQIIAGSSVLVGARMHACLNALSQGVPALPLAYSRKFAPLLGDLGWSHGLDLRDEIETSTLGSAVRSAAADSSAADHARRRGVQALESSFEKMRRQLHVIP